MSIDQNVNAPPHQVHSSSVNENEILTYRAISPRAVFSLIFGVLAILCYTHWFFLLFAATAIVLGITADRRIQRFPDMLTGRGLAQTGVTLGLVFGLTSVTIAGVQGFLRERQAKSFARQYGERLVKGSLDELIWLGQAPNVRKNTTPEKLVKDMKAANTDQQMFLMQTAGIRDLKDQLSKPGAEVHFEKIEDHGIDGLNLYATALYDVHLSGEPQEEERPIPEGERFALAYLKATKVGGRYEWWVEELKFPYKPSSFVKPQAPVDDGHGHGPGEGH
ncbi:MAG: DUF4190 domain-containing protein [Isosphaeraceae bacterium]